MTFIDSTALTKDSFTLTIPKKVREKLKILSVKYRVLSFNLEEDEKTITIGFKGNQIIGSSEFFGSYQITIPRIVRDLLELKKGESLGFWQKENGKIEMRKMN